MFYMGTSDRYVKMVQERRKQVERIRENLRQCGGSIGTPPRDFALPLIQESCVDTTNSVFFK